MRILIGLIIGVLLGGFGGYFVGFDHGFRGAFAQFPLDMPAVDTFGDAAQTMASLIGSWRSTQDERFTREFRNDGVVIDRYEGSEPPSEGLWMVFTKDIPDEAYTGHYKDDGVYLAIAISESEKLYFEVLRADAAGLDLMFLDGGVLSFTRIQ